MSSGLAGLFSSSVETGTTYHLVASVLFVAFQIFSNTTLEAKRMAENFCKVTTGWSQGASVMQIAGMVSLFTLYFSQQLKEVTEKESANGEKETDIKKVSALDLMSKMKMGTFNISSVFMSLLTLSILLLVIIIAVTSTTDGIFIGQECFPDTTPRVIVYMLIAINIIVTFILYYLLYYFEDCSGRTVMDVIKSDEDGVLIHPGGNKGQVSEPKDPPVNSNAPNSENAVV